jgi:hypothetical protein
MTESLSAATIILAFALAMSLLVERLLEVLKSCFDYWDSRTDGVTRWNRRAERVRAVVERRLRLFEYVKPEQVRPVLNRIYDLLLNNQGVYDGTVLVLSADMVRIAWIRIACKIVGMVLGVGLAILLRFDFVRLWFVADAAGERASNLPPAALTIFVSGLAVGLGAGPVHKIIGSIEKRRARKEAADVKEAGES